MERSSSNSRYVPLSKEGFCWLVRPCCGDHVEVLLSLIHSHRPAQTANNLSGTVPPKPLNLSPTIDNLYDIVKEINGIGEASNSFGGEVWSSNVVKALHEHEQVLSIQNNDDFDVKDYVVATTAEDPVLSAQFEAVARHMKVSCDPSS